MCVCVCVSACGCVMPLLTREPPSSVASNESYQAILIESTVPGGELNFLVTVGLYYSYPKRIFLTRNLLLHSTYSRRFDQTSNLSKAIVINSVCFGYRFYNLNCLYKYILYQFTYTSYCIGSWRRALASKSRT